MLKVVGARRGNVRLKSVRARLGKSEAQKVTLVNVRARRGNVRLKNVKAQRSFSEADKTRHLQEARNRKDKA